MRRQSVLPEAVLHNGLVQGGIELGMQDVPRTVVQETDHIGRLSVHMDAVFNIRLPEIVAPRLLETPR